MKSLKYKPSNFYQVKLLFLTFTPIQNLVFWLRLKNVNGTDVTDAGKDVAMQIAAMNPVAVDKDGVDASIVEKEVEIGKDQARQEGKPEELVEKIALGKLNKFFKENTLLSQAFVKG